MSPFFKKKREKNGIIFVRKLLVKNYMKTVWKKREKNGFKENGRKTSKKRLKNEKKTVRRQKREKNGFGPEKNEKKTVSKKTRKKRDKNEKKTVLFPTQLAHGFSEVDVARWKRIENVLKTYWKRFFPVPATRIEQKWQRTNQKNEKNEKKTEPWKKREKNGFALEKNGKKTV